MKVGDAVLGFTADMTQLDAAFEQIGPKTEAALAPAQAAVAGIGAEMDKAAAQVQQGAAEISDANLKLAQATFENQKAQREVQQALKQVYATGGTVATVMERYARALQDAKEKSQALAAAQAETTVATEEVAAATTESTVSIAEAKAEMALLGEETGVKVPRHLRGFIAQLPGVGKALNAAFAATAILMIIQLIVEAGIKLYEFAMKGIEAAAKISEAWSKSTGEIRTHNDELQVTNDKLEVEIAKLEHKPANMLKLALDENIVAADKLAASLAKDYDAVEKLLKENHVGGMASFVGMFTGGSKSTSDEEALIRRLAKGLKEIGDQGRIAAGEARTEDEKAAAAAKTRLELQQAITKAINETSQGIQHLDKSENLEGQFMSIDPKSLEASKALLGAYLNQLKVMQAGFNEQDRNDRDVATKARLEQQKTANDEHLKLEEARIAATKKTADAEIDVDAAKYKVLYALGVINYGELVQIQSELANAKLAAERKQQQDLLALYEKDPTKNAAKIREINAQIEAADKELYAHRLAAEAEFLQKRKELLSRVVPEHNPVITGMIAMSAEGQKLEEQMQRLQAIFQSVGIVGSEAWRKQMEAAQANLRIAKENGATQFELLQLDMKRLQAIIAYKTSMGQSATAEKAQLAALNAQFGQLTGSVEKLGKAHNSAGKLLDRFASDLHEVQKTAITTKEVFDALSLEMSQAIGSAVQAWVSGQKSLGQALEESLAQEAATIAGKATMWALYFTAWGIADLFWAPERAGADFGAAAEFAAVAALAGGAAYGLGQAAGSGSSSGGSGSSNQGGGVTYTGPTMAASNPVQSTNVHRFAAGGLVSSPTLAVIGDSMRSASDSATEAILPLDDPKSMAKLREGLGGGSGKTIHVHLPNVRGVISSDVLDDVIGQVNRRVENGGVRLVASESRKVIRRS